MNPTPPPDKFTIAWFCIIPAELTAAYHALDVHYQDFDSYEGYKDRYELGGDDNIYRFGRIGTWNIVLVKPLRGAGAANVASALKDLTRSFKKLRYYFLVGMWVDLQLTPPCPHFS